MMASERTSLSLPSWAPFFLLFLAVLSSCAANHDAAPASGRKVYIVYMGHLPEGTVPTDAEAAHKDLLDRVLGSGSSSNILHSYKRSFNGFCAMLSEEEAKSMAAMDGVVSVFPSKTKKLHTTRSWDFMSFPSNVLRSSSAESNMIVGMIDTGIWPSSKSFDDKGFGPPPSKWKGSCASNFECSNKIVGARFYRADGKFADVDVRSPLDSEGHGSHTASTVAGKEVSDVSLYGLGLGTARGGVPSARIAAYKVCWSDGCQDADILAAFDDAIADGVDVLSVSLGASSALDYLEDPIAIGSFHAMRNGILTSNSAGNSGPYIASAANVAPWTMTVAASTIDRRFVAEALLGDGKIYQGAALNTFNLKNKVYPLIYGGDAANKSAITDIVEARECWDGALSKDLVTGKIVFCDAPIDGDAVGSVGGVGSIMRFVNNPYRYTDYAVPFSLPATVVDLKDGAAVFSYINKTKSPTATIARTKPIKDSKAPYVVSFSSRGPSTITDVLKPDLTAPGVDILAAWSPMYPITSGVKDTRKVSYNIISGTSMSCPHASAAAAYVKSFHPDWSPAAIRSALMTTARRMTASSNPEAELAYGAGQIDPLKAVNPGLVYDAGEADYVKMLCDEGYDTKSLRGITGDKSVCPAPVNTSSDADLNYPSFAVRAPSTDPASKRFLRTVTNVGSGKSTYRATVTAPPQLKVDVQPTTLSFQRAQDKQSFVVNVVATVKNQDTVLSASLVWSDGVHHVRSPIVGYMDPGDYY